MREIARLAELRDMAGTEVAVSDWFGMPQQRIAAFADATDDHQWIHLDPARCARESPFGTTVAHGFLTLSLLPAMLGSALRIRDVRLLLNYGLNKVRFPAPVPADSRVRARLVLRSYADVQDGAQLAWDVTVEREGEARPVCVAEFVVRCCL